MADLEQATRELDRPAGAVAKEGSKPAPIIEVREICKSYGTNVVLDKLCFDVSPGEKIALIGPSGSGKTTILRLLMTLETPDAGLIKVDGLPLWHREVDGKLVPANEAHLQKMRTKVGMVFQLFNLFPHKSVLENVSLPQILTRKTPRAEAERYGLELLDMVGMAEKAREKPASLSGGQKQRVAIARALALQPKIMLFDEVTSALDPELVEEVLNILRRLGQETEMTMLLVTHEMGFAHDFADRVLFFDGGRVVEQGPPAQIFTNPQQERTQSFLRKITGAGRAI